MLNKKEFVKIRKELDKAEKLRESVIQGSREAIRLSKQIIYALHRNDVKKAASLVKKIKSRIKSISSEDCGTGMRRVALQEYTEALALYSFVKFKKIPARAELGVETESYLIGLCDLTGELMRMAVNKAIMKKYDDVLEIKELVDTIYGEFLQFDLRNSELRKKSDQIKWNLQKLGDMVYNIAKK